MSMSDPIADMLTRIRNASQARHPSCEMPASRMKLAIAEVLRDEGYIDSFEERATPRVSTFLIWKKLADAAAR